MNRRITFEASLSFSLGIFGQLVDPGIIRHERDTEMLCDRSYKRRPLDRPRMDEVEERVRRIRRVADRHVVDAACCVVDRYPGHALCAHLLVVM
jgi:hypothetical protein